MQTNVIARKTEGLTKQSISGLPRSRMVARNDKLALPVYSVTPFTMLDFPGHTACVVWFTGCNMRCPYCHNPDLVRRKGGGQSSTAQVMDFLEKRKGLLDGIVLSGGEATLFPGLSDFIEDARALGYKIKLDTNGTRPDVLASLLEKNMLDYIALDYKAPREKYTRLTAHKRFENFEETLALLCGQKAIPFEVRTTVHTNLLDEDDLSAIILDLDRRGYKGTYFLQNFRADNDRPTLGMLPEQSRTLDREKLPAPQNFAMSFRNFQTVRK